MLAANEAALIAALKARPGLQRSLRTVGAIPNVPSEKLLQQYSTDAPAVYVAAPTLAVGDLTASLRFTLAILVRNVGSRDQARGGNAVELGIDQLFTLVCRTVHGKRIGDATWWIKRAEYADDDLFIKQGLTALEVSIESTAIELPYETDDVLSNGSALVDGDVTLGDLERLHIDFDIAPQATAADYGRWLASPPDYSTAQPDAQADVQLTGD